MTLIWQGDIDNKKGVWKGGRALRDGQPVRTAFVSCPVCGKSASLRMHDIAPDGKVTPSLVCPYEPCTFHDYVQLDGWTPEPV